MSALDITALIEKTESLIQNPQIGFAMEISFPFQTVEAAHPQLSNGYAELRSLLRNNNQQEITAGGLDEEKLIR